jgi:hypothetical protein
MCTLYSQRGIGTTYGTMRTNCGPWAASTRASPFRIGTGLPTRLPEGVTSAPTARCAVRSNKIRTRIICNARMQFSISFFRPCLQIGYIQSVENMQTIVVAFKNLTHELLTVTGLSGVRRAGARTVHRSTLRQPFFAPIRVLFRFPLSRRRGWPFW